jgi:hypothetical protein
MDLLHTRIAPLTQIPIIIEGRWMATTPKEPSPRWHGRARAAEPLVAILFVTVQGQSAWCKSERARADDLKITLTLYPYDEPCLVQVNATAGGAGRRFATRIPRPEYRPTVPSSIRITTGLLASFTAVLGEPAVTVSVLCLAAKDVTVGRHGLWRVRPALAQQISGPFQAILTRGRTGEVGAA